MSTVMGEHRLSELAKDLAEAEKVAEVHTGVRMALRAGLTLLAEYRALAAEYGALAGQRDGLAVAVVRAATPTEDAIRWLERIKDRDPERAHVEADDILLGVVPPEVREAYEQVAKRQKAWWSA